MQTSPMQSTCVNVPMNTGRVETSGFSVGVLDTNDSSATIRGSNLGGHSRRTGTFSTIGFPETNPAY